MKNIWQKLVAKKKRLILVAPLIMIIAMGLLIAPKPALGLLGTGIQPVAHAVVAAATPNNLENFILEATGKLTSVLVTFLGKLLTVVIGILISIAQYNGFVSSPVVDKGWVLIRDICNMFFVVILIIMAFGTVFQKEQYSYKRLLASLVFAAVLVNFSKVICGVIIDFSQVIMLTFINAVKGAAAGNFAELIGLRRFLSITLPGTQSATGVSAGTGINLWQTLMAYLLADILSVVALVVFVVITIIILLRIVQLWFLVMLSPLAFLATVGIPRLSAYANKWWAKFGSQVIIGPVLAIFLWLSLAVVADGFNSPAHSGAAFLTKDMTNGLGTGAEYSVIGSGSASSTPPVVGGGANSQQSVCSDGSGRTCTAANQATNCAFAANSGVCKTNQGTCNGGTNSGNICSSPQDCPTPPGTCSPINGTCSVGATLDGKSCSEGSPADLCYAPCEGGGNATCQGPNNGQNMGNEGAACTGDTDCYYTCSVVSAPVPSTPSANGSTSGNTTSTGLTATVTDIGQAGNLLGFIVGIAMLIASLSMAQEMGVAGASIATKAAGKMKDVAQGAQNLGWKGVKAPFSLAKRGGKAAATSIGERFQAATGIPILPSEIKRQFKAGQEKRRADRYQEYQRRRAPLSDQWREAGWVGGTGNFIANILGRDKTLRGEAGKQLDSVQKYQDTHIQETDYNKSTSDRANLDAERIKQQGQRATLMTLNTVDPEQRAAAEFVRTGLEDQKAIETDATRKQDLDRQIGLVNQALGSNGSINLDNPNLADAAQVFTEITEPNIADQIKGLNQTINKLDEDMAALDKQTSKTKVSDAEWSKQVVQPLNAIKKSYDRAREIQGPMYATQSIREAGIAAKEKELPKYNNNRDVFLGILEQAKNSGDFLQYQAAMRVMAAHGDGNEPILHDSQNQAEKNHWDSSQLEKSGFDTATISGWTHWKDYLKQTFAEKGVQIDDSELKEVITEWCDIASKNGQVAMASPFLLDTRLGTFRTKTEQEYLGEIAYQRRGLEPESAIRKGPKLAVCGEKMILTPEGKFNRIPVYDQRSLDFVLGLLGNLHKESKVEGGRINDELLKYVGNATAVNFMATRALPELIRRGGTDDQIKKLAEAIKNLSKKFAAAGTQDPGGEIVLPPIKISPVKLDLKISGGGKETVADVLKEAGVDPSSLT